MQNINISFCHNIVWVLRCTNIVKHIWQLSSFTCGVPPYVISGTNGHVSRTNDVPSASWIASSHERIQSPWRHSNPQRWWESYSKSTTLTTRPPTLFVIIYQQRMKDITRFKSNSLAINLKQIDSSQHWLLCTLFLCSLRCTWTDPSVGILPYLAC